MSRRFKIISIALCLVTAGHMLAHSAAATKSAIDHVNSITEYLNSPQPTSAQTESADEAINFFNGDVTHSFGMSPQVLQPFHIAIDGFLRNLDEQELQAMAYSSLVDEHGLILREEEKIHAPAIEKLRRLEPFHPRLLLFQPGQRWGIEFRFEQFLRFRHRYIMDLTSSWVSLLNQAPHMGFIEFPRALRVTMQIQRTPEPARSRLIESFGR